MISEPDAEIFESQRVRTVFQDCKATCVLAEHGVVHGAITRLGSFGIDVLPFEDPDGIQLELTAPVAPDA